MLTPPKSQHLSGPCPRHCKLLFRYVTDESRTAESRFDRESLTEIEQKRQTDRGNPFVSGVHLLRQSAASFGNVVRDSRGRNSLEPPT